MAEILDDEIAQIVQRVLNQTLGARPGSVPDPPCPKPVDPASNKEISSSEMPVIAIGGDHGGYELKEILKGGLGPLGFDVIDVGTHSKDPVDYPDIAHAVANLVNAGRAWRGIIIDGAGIGSCIVANKIPGVRAGLAYDYSSALNSREHNDTNVLTLGAGLIGANLAKQIVKVWLGTEFGGGRHAARVAKISAIEKLYLK
jgi:ribose 5-phosphate isomerase B